MRFLGFMAAFLAVFLLPEAGIGVDHVAASSVLGLSRL